MKALFQIIETGTVTVHDNLSVLSKSVPYFKSAIVTHDLRGITLTIPIVVRSTVNAYYWLYNGPLELKSIYELRFTNAISNH